MFNIKPYQFLEYNQDSFCCGDYVRLILKDHCGICLPVIQFLGGPLNAAKQLRELPYRDSFRKIENPREWCVVEMQRFRSADHVGVCVKIGDKLLVTHCESGAGVLINTLEEIQEVYKIVGFYEYRSQL